MIDAAQLTSPSLAPLEALIDPSFPEVWVSIAAGLYTEAASSGGLPSLTDAARLAVAQMHRIVELFGGNAVYIPSGAAIKAKALQRSVALGFNGSNHAALARQHGITTMRVRQIMDAERKAKRKA